MLHVCVVDSLVHDLQSTLCDSNALSAAFIVVRYG